MFCQKRTYYDHILDIELTYTVKKGYTKIKIILIKKQKTGSVSYLKKDLQWPSLTSGIQAVVDLVVLVHS